MRFRSFPQAHRRQNENGLTKRRVFPHHHIIQTKNKKKEQQQRIENAPHADAGVRRPQIDPDRWSF